MRHKIHINAKEFLQAMLQAAGAKAGYRGPMSAVKVDVHTVTLDALLAQKQTADTPVVTVEFTEAETKTVVMSKGGSA